MALHGLLELAEAAPGFDGLAERLAAGGEASAGMVDAAKPLLLAALWRRLRRPMAIIVARAETARLLHEQTLAYAGEDAPAYVLPELDSTPYERLASDRSTVSQRVAALWTLGASAESGRDGSGPPLLIGSAYAFASKTLDPTHMAGLTHTIRRGGRLDPMQALRRWTSMGYRVEPAVEVPGDVSRRGGILDIFPPSSERPVRIDLFGDTIDAIRFFDPESQRSLDPVQSVTITPATELAPEDDRPLHLDTADLAEESRERVEADLEKLAAGEPFDEQDFYRGLAARRPATAHLPKGGIVVLDNPRRIGDALDEVHAQAVELRERLASRGELPAALPTPYASLDDIRAPVQRGAVLTFEPFGADDVAWPFTPPPSYSGRTRALIEDAPRMRGEGRRVVLVSQQAPRLSELLEEAGVTATPSESLPDLPPLGSVTLVHGSLAEGWALDAEQTTVLTDARDLRPLQAKALPSKAGGAPPVLPLRAHAGRLRGAHRSRHRQVRRRDAAQDGGARARIPRAGVRPTRPAPHTDGPDRPRGAVPGIGGADAVADPPGHAGMEPGQGAGQGLGGGGGARPARSLRLAGGGFGPPLRPGYAVAARARSLLPLRRDAGPAARHRRSKRGHGEPQAHGPGHHRRRGLWQDGGGAAGGVSRR